MREAAAGSLRECFRAGMRKTGNARTYAGRACAQTNGVRPSSSIGVVGGVHAKGPHHLAWVRRRRRCRHTGARHAAVAWLACLAWISASCRRAGACVRCRKKATAVQCGRSRVTPGRVARGLRAEKSTAVQCRRSLPVAPARRVAPRLFPDPN
jgi:hypothetical protein